MAFRPARLLAFLLFFLLSIPAFAEPSAQDKFSKAFGSFSVHGKLPQPTPEQIDESFSLYDSCKASDMDRLYYDCECLSSTYLELRRGRPDDRQVDVENLARKKCANDTAIAGWGYQRCLTWNSAKRADPEEYCTCFASSYAKIFRKNPDDTIRGREWIMTKAMNSCESDAEVAQDNALKRVVEYLTHSGLYQSLFPASRPQKPQEQAPNPQQ